MTKYYTSIVSFDTAILLKYLGYSKTWGYQYDKSGKLVDPAAPGGIEGICEAPTYAEVFDWLLEKGFIILIAPFIDPEKYKIGDKINGWNGWLNGGRAATNVTWHEAANAAIEKAIEILKKR